MNIKPIVKIVDKMERLSHMHEQLHNYYDEENTCGFSKDLKDFRQFASDIVLLCRDINANTLLEGVSLTSEQVSKLNPDLNTITSTLNAIAEGIEFNQPLGNTLTPQKMTSVDNLVTQLKSQTKSITHEVGYMQNNDPSELSI